MESNVGVLCVSRAPKPPLTQEHCRFPSALCIVRQQALAVSPTSTCQHVLLWCGVEFLNSKVKLWKSLVPQGPPVPFLLAYLILTTWQNDSPKWKFYIF